jgi:acyl-coenzyme A thioesterase PaaI-like protein
LRAADFLGAQQLEGTEPGADGVWRFEIGRELHGAFGGAFGGVVTAAAVMTARSVAKGRVPVALDVRFLRSLPAGTATAAPSVLHSGRTLSCISVDLCTDDGRLAARSTVSLVAPEALAPLSREPDSRPIPLYDTGRAWPPVGAPIIETLAPRTVAWPDTGDALCLRVPWDDDPDASAEAACLPADMAVGPPVVLGVAAAEGVAHPNPDLSLRFAAPITGGEVIGVGRLERVHAGIATVAVEVWSASGLAAIGVSSSTLLALK